jgi:hypothetical protein
LKKKTAKSKQRINKILISLKKRIELNVQSAYLCVYFDKIPLGVPEKRKLFGEEEKGMECLL